MLLLKVTYRWNKQVYLVQDISGNLFVNYKLNTPSKFCIS